MHLTWCLKSERKLWIQQNIDYTIKFYSPFSLVNLFLTIQSTYRFLENHNAKLLTAAAAAWECQIDLSLTALSMYSHTHKQSQLQERTESKGTGASCWSPLPIRLEAQLGFLLYFWPVSPCISHPSAPAQVRTDACFLIAKANVAFSCTVHHVVSSQRWHCPIVFNRQRSVLDQ